MFLVSSRRCLRSIHWSQVLSWEWRCSWSSADRRCSNYIWVINNFIAYEGATYIRGFTVYTLLFPAVTILHYPWGFDLHYILIINAKLKVTPSPNDITRYLRSRGFHLYKILKSFHNWIFVEEPIKERKSNSQVGYRWLSAKLAQRHLPLSLHYSGVKWAPWRLKLPTSRLFVQQLVWANNKKAKFQNHWWRDYRTEGQKCRKWFHISSHPCKSKTQIHTIK